MKGAVSVADESFGAPSLFIVGNEGAGIRQKTFERCDVGPHPDGPARSIIERVRVGGRRALCVEHQASIRAPII